MSFSIAEEHRLDAGARRAAKHAGLRARRSRWRAGSIDNCGGFQLIRDNWIVAGEKFDLTAQDVIEVCASYRQGA